MHASLLGIPALAMELWGPWGARAGQPQHRTAVLHRENDSRRPVFRQLRSGVARLETRADSPLRDAAAGSPVPQIDRRRTGNPDPG